MRRGSAGRLQAEEPVIRRLVIGNSHVAALKAAGAPDGLEVDWFAIPGGYGPALRVEGARVWPADPAAKPSMLLHRPADPFDGLDLSCYQQVLFSAAGPPAARAAFVRHPFVALSLAAWADPAVDHGPARVSQAVWRLALERALHPQHGVRALLDLAAVLGERLTVQPVPLPSARAVDLDGGWLRHRYGSEAGAAVAWAWSVQHQCLRERVARCAPSVRWLSLPDPDWLQTGFTPSALADPADAWHMNADYGATVMRQWLATA